MFLIYLFSLLAGLFYGITESINKNITEKKYSAFSYAFIQFAFNFIIYAVLYLLFFQFPQNPVAFIHILISVIMILIGNVAIIVAYKSADISNLNIISRSSLVIAFLTGIFLLNEKITSLGVLGVATVIAGIMVIFYENKKLTFSPGYLEALVSGICYGGSTVFYKKAMAYTTPVSFYFYFYLMAVIMLLFIPKSLTDVKPIVKKYLKPILFGRIFLVAGSYIFISAIKYGNISIVNTNTETTLLLSCVFIGIIFLNERQNIAKKLAGSLICTLGIILLNFFT